MDPTIVDAPLDANLTQVESDWPHFEVSSSVREKRFSTDARFTARSPKKPVHTKLLLPTNRIKMEYFFPAKSKVKSFYKDGAITGLVSLNILCDAI